jgi:phage shock protein PspC (stress-responsive transcriptional regulator)
MQRNLNDKMLGGVLSGMANSLGISTGLLRVIFIVLYLSIGGITLGISAGAMTVIYFLLWMFIPGKYIMSATAQEEKTNRPIRPCFTIHKEYIHNDEIDGEDEVTPSNEIYPLFMSGMSFKEIINKEYAKINWYGLNDNVVDIITPNGVLTMTLFVENDGNLYNGVHVSVHLTDYPFIEIKALCKKYNWYLYHINSFSYLDIHDDSQIEEDYINNGPDIDLGEEYKYDMDDDDD